MPSGCHVNSVFSIMTKLFASPIPQRPFPHGGRRLGVGRCLHPISDSNARITIPWGAFATLMSLRTAVAPLWIDAVPLEPLFIRAMGVLVAVAAILLAGWFVVEPAVSRLVRRRNRNNPTLEEAITRYVRLLAVILALFVGVGVSGFTGFLGNSALVIAAVTVAVGVAGQSVIGSLVSGTALVVDPEFNVGDYIEWDGGEGEVTSITLRVTRVQTIDGGLVTIPNTTLTDEPITRPFEGGNCRSVEHITVSYEDDIETALYLLSDVTAEVDCILEVPEPEIGIEEFGDDGVVLHVSYWVDDPLQNMFAVRSTFARTVKDRFKQADIHINPSSKRDLEGELDIRHID